MPLETYVAIAAVLAVFGGYGAILAWGVWYTTKA